MTGKEIGQGLLQLGFNSGWVTTGDEITLWENEKPQPSAKEIADAAKLWAKTQTAEIKAKEAARSEILDRLGITADEAAILLG